MNLYDSFDPSVPTIVLAEGEFGRTGGKTANGIVLHSELFDTQVIIDSTCVEETPAAVLNNPTAPDIPIVADLDAAIKAAPNATAFVIGAATAGGHIPDAWEDQIAGAIEAGCDIVSGLHTFLSEQEYWQELAAEHDVELFDVRMPPTKSDLRVGDGSVDEVDADVVLTMGTDCAVGKRTTTFELYRTAKAMGRNVGWVATGQTGIMVGAQRGVVIDRVPADFTAGVVEEMVKEVAADNDLVFVEGQGALTHRTYSGVTLSILHGTWPDAVILIDDPNRSQRTHFEQFRVEGLTKERRLIEDLANTQVVAISTWDDPELTSKMHDLPAANVFKEGGSAELLDAINEVL